LLQKARNYKYHIYIIQCRKYWSAIPNNFTTIVFFYGKQEGEPPLPPYCDFIKKNKKQFVQGTEKLKNRETN
jgi:hypothetical protein